MIHAYTDLRTGIRRTAAEQMPSKQRARGDLSIVKNPRLGRLMRQRRRMRYAPHIGRLHRVCDGVQHFLPLPSRD